MITINPLLLLKANYLYEKGYNTYDEVMSMTQEQIFKRYDEITTR